MLQQLRGLLIHRWVLEPTRPIDQKLCQRLLNTAAVFVCRVTGSLHQPATGNEHPVEQRVRTMPALTNTSRQPAWPNILLWAGCISACLIFCNGCGGGPQLTHVSGKVTFDGKPLAKGRILFTPDESQGNAGTNAFAVIENGQYDTQAQGHGTIGGAHRVTIIGIADSPTGDPTRPGSDRLFEPFQTTADIPTDGPVELNFDVPR